MWTDDCSPDVIESIRTDMQRYLSYGWGNGIIAAMMVLVTAVMICILFS